MKPKQAPVASNRAHFKFFRTNITSPFIRHSQICCPFSNFPSSEKYCCTEVTATSLHAIEIFSGFTSTSSSCIIYFSVMHFFLRYFDRFLGRPITLSSQPIGRPLFRIFGRREIFAIRSVALTGPGDVKGADGSISASTSGSLASMFVGFSLFPDAKCKSTVKS